MGATISPSYHGLIRKVDPTAHKCSCGRISFVAWNDYAYGSPECECGEALYNIDFYPTEFEKVEAHFSYSSIGEMLNALGLPTEDESGEFRYSDVLPTDVVASRLNRLEGTRFYGLMTDMVSVAQMLGVDISYG